MPTWAAGPAFLAPAPEQAEAGPTGLFVVILLAIGIYFLGRSMIKHMRRVPQSFDPPPEPEPEPDPEPETGPGTVPPDAAEAASGPDRPAPPHDRETPPGG